MIRDFQKKLNCFQKTLVLLGEYILIEFTYYWTFITTYRLYTSYYVIDIIRIYNNNITYEQWATKSDILLITTNYSSSTVPIHLNFPENVLFTI